MTVTIDENTTIGRVLNYRGVGMRPDGVEGAEWVAILTATRDAAYATSLQRPEGMERARFAEIQEAIRVMEHAHTAREVRDINMMQQRYGHAYAVEYAERMTGFRGL